jgi:hypothetical protein
MNDRPPDYIRIMQSSTIMQEPRNGIPEAMEEARAVMIGAVTDLLEKTGAGRFHWPRERSVG